MNKWKQLRNNNKACIVLGNIGVAYSNLGNNFKAMEYYLKSLSLSEETKNVKQSINNLCNIASLYKDQGNGKKAFDYYGKSLKLAEDIKDERSIAIIEGNLGSLYVEQKKYVEALDSYFIALGIDKKFGNKRNISAWMANIGDVYQRLGELDYKAGNKKESEAKTIQALEHFIDALKFTEEVGDKYLESYALGNIGSIYTAQQKYSEAKICILKSCEIAKQIGATDIVIDSYQRLYELYKKTKMPLEALDHYEKYIYLKDSLSEENNKRTISELELRYNTELKENENKNLIQENRLKDLTIKNNRYLMLGLGVLAIIITGMSFLGWRQSKLKSIQSAAQLEQKLLRTQMNPHFIFNSLASIESFIYDHQPKEAGEYLSEFSRLMRLILENSTLEFIPLEKEIEILNYYLSLQKLRLDDNMLFSIVVDEELDPQKIYLPPMLTQPFIENSIEHGFRGSKRTGEITVSFMRSENNLNVVITDNGIGIENAQKQRDKYKTHKSKAMEITARRLKHLNKSKHKRVSLSVADVFDKNEVIIGTKIIFSIPLKENGM